MWEIEDWEFKKTIDYEPEEHEEYGLNSQKISTGFWDSIIS